MVQSSAKSLVKNKSFQIFEAFKVSKLFHQIFICILKTFKDCLCLCTRHPSVFTHVLIHMINSWHRSIFCLCFHLSGSLFLDPESPYSLWAIVLVAVIISVSWWEGGGGFCLMGGGDGDCGGLLFGSGCRGGCCCWFLIGLCQLGYL